ncbi:YhcN/YlaJ family sporulation lipoprotein [Bacillus sp. FJAT-42376]|uniref:YhcN/YlaJ family sporulation lipoprotein n=1 Tax=Bacillus sp. FJAT-42376 TaxID=2014076 RepID=UPI0013DE1A91|nr:YhcN/YlaJ family sporulation lipoprotein [Bacillus sp. FJAT-42376]
MKRFRALFIAATFLSAPACQKAEEGQNLTDQNGSTINVNEKTDMYKKTSSESKKEQRTENYGFVRHKKSSLTDNGQQTEFYGINRKELADTISGLAVQLPGIEEAAALVTDEEVLIAYRGSGKNRNEMADMVSKTAISVVPRYYHVYISDQPAYFDQLQSYSKMDAQSPDADAIISKLIRQMLNDSPQGKSLNKGENANGEGYGEKNEKMDEDMKDSYEKTRYK